MRESWLPPRLARAVSWTLRVVAAAGLAVDAYVHADRAAEYDLNRNAAISQGDLFRVEAGVSAFLALLILLVAWRVVWALVFLVAASALGAVLLYAHVDVGKLGPLPDMYEPLWYPLKTRSAIAEGVAAGAALLGFLTAGPLPWLSRRHAPAPPVDGAEALPDRATPAGRARRHPVMPGRIRHHD